MKEEKKKVNTDFVEIPDSKTGLEKVDATVTTFLNEVSTGRLFRSIIGYVYQKVHSESVKVLTTKTVSEKVASTVATFLNGLPFPFSNSFTITQIRGYL